MVPPGIDLENIVYYKDDTHYFVMTAKKQSLLEKGVILHVSDQSSDRSVTCVYAIFTSNDLTKPTVLRSELPSPARSLSVWILIVHCSFLSLAAFHRKLERLIFVSV